MKSKVEAYAVTAWSVPSGSHEETDSLRIARERVGMARMSRLTAGGFIAIGLVQLGLLLWLVGRTAELTAIESNFFQTRGIGQLYGQMDLASARSMSVIFSATGVILMGMAARKLFHSDIVGLGVAVALVGDPANLVYGQYATGHSVAFALQAAALLMFLSPAYMRWPAGIVLGLAAALDPWSSLWGLGFLVLVLMRGHIYAAPQHIVGAMGPTLLLPLIGASVGAWSRAIACNSRVDAIFLANSTPFGDSVAMSHPLIWILGSLSLAVWGLGSLIRILTKFRISRQPGRIQLRLDNPLPPEQGRFMWLMWLWILAPPLMSLPLLAFALAGGVNELGRDAKGFGLGATIVVILSVGIVLARLWGIVDGSSSAAIGDIQGYLPWHEVSPCESLAT